MNAVNEIISRILPKKGADVSRRSSRSEASVSASGDESDRTYPAGEEDSLSETDRKRAAVCCVAVNEEYDDAKETFAKYKELNFANVILTPDLIRQKSRILVANAYDPCEEGSEVVLTSYVAFKGSSALESVFDVASSKLQCEGQDGKPVSMKGHIHNGFYKALMEELPNPADIMAFCASQPTEKVLSHVRLIFCGHGLGGTLSHVSMLNLLFTWFALNPEELKKPEHTTTFLSVAFGAPLFLDEEGRHYFSERGKVPVENRFFTYINDKDPVPQMLCDLKACPTGWRLQDLHSKLNRNFETILEYVGKIPPPPEMRGVGGSRRNPPNNELEEIDADIKRLREMQPRSGRAYAAFGQFLKLSDGGEQFSVHLQTHRTSSTSSWTPETVKYHAMSYYAFSIVSPVPTDQVPPPNVEEGSPPKIDEAFLVMMSGPQQGEANAIRLEVVGFNLGLCIREKCEVSDFKEKWDLSRLEPNKIVFRNRTKLTESQVRLLGNQLPKVKIETIFGSTERVQVQLRAPGADSIVVRGLKHVIGKIVIFETLHDTRPGPLETATNSLRQHLRTAAETIDLPAKVSLEKFYGSLQDAELKTIDKRRGADPFIEQVSNYLNQITLYIKQPPRIGEGDTRMFIIRNGLLAAVLAVLIMVTVMGSGIPLAGLLLGLIPLYLTYRREVQLEDYDMILKFIYAHLKPDEPILREEANVADYERAIINSANSDPDWARHVTKELIHQVEETRDIVVKLVQLMSTINNAVQLAKKHKVIAVVGPENVGKSTLINILRNGAASDDDEDKDGESEAAKTGFTLHTDDPRGYLVTAEGMQNLVAVDFPGMGAAHERRACALMWEAFEQLPDLCLVLMKFNGDVTSDCAEVPKHVRKKLCDKVVLMMNHVDGIMKGRRRAKVWTEYSVSRVEELRQGYLRNSGNTLDSVMLTSLSRDLFYEEKILLEERGILFAKGTLDQIKQFVDRN